VLNCSAYAAQAPGLMILSLGYFAMNVFLCCEPTKENGTQVKKIKLRVFIGQAGNPASYPATSWSLAQSGWNDTTFHFGPNFPFTYEWVESVGKEQEQEKLFLSKSLLGGNVFPPIPNLATLHIIASPVEPCYRIFIKEKNYQSARVAVPRSIHLKMETNASVQIDSKQNDAESEDSAARKDSEENDASYEGNYFKDFYFAQGDYRNCWSKNWFCQTLYRQLVLFFSIYWWKEREKKGRNSQWQNRQINSFFQIKPTIFRSEKKITKDEKDKSETEAPSGGAAGGGTIPDEKKRRKSDAVN
jgi:hypothetical protein